MTPEVMVRRAFEIAQDAHRGQLDKAGEPYIEHCRRVAEQVKSADEKAVAYLHDVVEKTRRWPIERLQAEGFPRPVLAAVQALTRASSESHESFIRRALSNKLAADVKVADLRDNLVQALQLGGDVTPIMRDLATATAKTVSQQAASTV